MKLTAKNSINISEWQNDDDQMKKRAYNLISSNLKELPTEIEMSRSGVHSGIKFQYLNQPPKNMSIPGQFFIWITSHVKFVKRRCFCIIDDKMIGATIHKSGGLWLSKIEIYASPLI